MAKKTNKTDHVLKLLAGDKAEPAGDEKKAPSSKKAENEAPPVQLSAPPVELPGNISVIHASGGENDPVADSIKEKLGELMEEMERAEGKQTLPETDKMIEPEKMPVLQEEAPASETVPEAGESLVPDSVPKAEESSDPEIVPETEEAFDPKTSPESVQMSALDQEPQHQTENEPLVSAKKEELPEELDITADTTVQESASVEELQPMASEACEPVTGPEPPVLTAQEEDGEREYAFVNVMERIVRDKVLMYMEQFGNCTCDRCYCDTVALTLTNLPSKYVVVNKSAVSPLFNFYTKKYAGQVMVEITKACIQVDKHPHHDQN